MGLASICRLNYSKTIVARIVIVYQRLYIMKGIYFSILWYSFQKIWIKDINATNSKLIISHLFFQQGFLGNCAVY